MSFELNEDVKKEIEQDIKNAKEFRTSIKNLERICNVLVLMADNFAEVGNPHVSDKCYKLAGSIESELDILTASFNNCENQILSVNQKLNSSMFDTIMVLADKKDKQT